MFKFSFDVESESENPFDRVSKEVLEDKEVSNSNSWYESEEVLPSMELMDNLDVYKFNSKTLNVGGIRLTHIVSGFLLESFKDHKDNSSTNDISQAEESHSDLLPGIYEGGAKIWECTNDLLNYLYKKFPVEFWSNKRVLDLGCGSGLLGIYAHKCGAKVHFQDYNKDVIEKITIPNVVLNVSEESKTNDIDLKSLSEEVKFYSGDWFEYTQLTKNNKGFDIILTSETIYNPDNQGKLLDTCFAKLKANGTVFVAAKTYYFGVGGGLRQFENKIATGKSFQSRVLWTSNEGVSREIIELRPI